MNYNKLKGLMKEKNITQNQLAREIGLCPTSLNRKLNGKRDFTISEINSIALYFNIFDDIQKYFFSEKL